MVAPDLTFGGQPLVVRVVHRSTAGCGQRRGGVVNPTRSEAILVHDFVYLPYSGVGRNMALAKICI